MTAAGEESAPPSRRRPNRSHATPDLFVGGDAMLHIIHTVESLVLSALIVAAAAFGGDGLLRIGMAIATKALTIYLSLLSGF